LLYRPSKHPSEDNLRSVLRAKKKLMKRYASIGWATRGASSTIFLEHSRILWNRIPAICMSLQAFCNADWTFNIHNKPNEWSKHLQPSPVQRMNTGALAPAASKVSGFSSFYIYMSYKFKFLASALNHNLVLDSTIYMQLNIFLFWEKVINKSLIVANVPSQEQVADTLRKPRVCGTYDEYKIWYVLLYMHALYLRLFS
jgi:hypothetical protein